MNQKPLIWSYTLLHTYKSVCSYQAFRRYILKDIPFVETDAMRWGNQVHEAFEHRVAGGKPLPANMQQWEEFARPFDGRSARTELKLGITREGKPTGFFDKDVWGRGKVDVAIFNDSLAFINDWKTGKSRFEDEFELELHALLLKAKYPHLQKVVGTYTYLGENKVSKPYDLSNFNSTWGEVCEIMRNMERDRASGEFEKTKTPLCGYCGVKDCENRYEAIKK